MMYFQCLRYDKELAIDMYLQLLCTFKCNVQIEGMYVDGHILLCSKAIKLEKIRKCVQLDHLRVQPRDAVNC